MDKKAKMLSELEELKMAEKDSSTPKEALDGIREAIDNLQKKIENIKDATPKASKPKPTAKAKVSKPNLKIKEAQKIAKELKSKDSSLTHSEAVKKAWAQIKEGKSSEAKPTERKKIDKIKVVAKPKESAKKAVIKKANEAPKKKNELVDKIHKAKAKIKRIGKTYSYKLNGDLRTFARDKKKDGLRDALPVGKRISKEGNVYYEYRENRADANIGRKSYKRPNLFAKGGEVDSNLAMVKNQCKELMHHAKELSEVLKKNPEIEAWVVGKIERATTDLSDVTHYLDGMKYAKGGQIPKAYTHFIVRKSDNKIINGYDYKGVDSDDIKYFTKEDFKQMGLSPKDFTLVGKTFLISKGIDPYNVDNWTNNFAKGGILNSSEEKMFKEWMEDGNVNQNHDGTYSTQDALWSNKIADLNALKKYFKKEFLS